MSKYKFLQHAEDPFQTLGIILRFWWLILGGRGKANFFYFLFLIELLYQFCNRNFAIEYNIYNIIYALKTQKNYFWCQQFPD